MIQLNYNTQSMKATLMTILASMKAKNMYSPNRLLLKSVDNKTRIAISIQKNSTGMTTYPIIQRHGINATDIDAHETFNEMIASSGISNLMKAEQVISCIAGVEKAITSMIVSAQGQMLPTAQQVLDRPFDMGGMIIIPRISGSEIIYIYEFTPDVSVVVKNDLQY